MAIQNINPDILFGAPGPTKTSKKKALLELLPLIFGAVTGGLAGGGRGALAGLGGAGRATLEKQAFEEQKRMEEQQAKAVEAEAAWKRMLEESREKRAAAAEQRAQHKEATDAAEAAKRYAIGVRYGGPAHGAPQITPEEQARTTLPITGVTVEQPGTVQAGLTKDIAEKNVSLIKPKLPERPKKKADFASEIAALEAVIGPLTQEQKLKKAGLPPADSQVSEQRKLAIEKSKLELEKMRIEIADAKKTGAPKPKQLSAEAAKVYSIATSMPAEIEEIKKAYRTAYKSSVAGVLTGTNRYLTKVVNNVSDKVGRLRSGGAINKDEMATFRGLIVAKMDLVTGNPEDALRILDNLSEEVRLVRESIESGTYVDKQSGTDEEVIRYDEKGNRIR